MTFAAGLALLFVRASAGSYSHHRRCQHLFVILNTSSDSPPAIFSASYIGHEIETGKLTPLFLRFYHALYQAMIGAMNMALVANNIGLLWVGLEVATLSPS